MKIKSIKGVYRIFIVLYTLFLIYMMLIGFGRISTEIRPIQFIPFETISKFFSGKFSFYAFFINIICNIILFIPFGFLGLIIKFFKSVKYLLPFFISVIIFIELLQIISGRGYGEVDDVILNTFGMLIGYLMFKFLNNGKLMKSIAINSN